MELVTAHGHKHRRRSGCLKVPAITAVHTLARVAEMIGESEDLLHDLSIEMEPEDGCLALYGPSDEYTPAFTRDRFERLREMLLERRQPDLPLET